MKPLREHLARKVFQVNETAAHERPLTGPYSYCEILGVDLVELCARAWERKRATVRVLDVGCGSGLALHQLAEALARRGLAERFELIGLGLNWYKRMHITPRQFLMSGLYHLHHRGPRFDLVVSVFAFHYLWHKLEGLEKIHDELLADGGEAVLHFPAFLAQLPGDAAASLDEDAGNEAFRRFLAERERAHPQPRLVYTQVPQHSDDEDAVLLNEFGNLRFTRAPGASLDFGLVLARFGVVPPEFRYRHGGVSKPDYVLSRYERRVARPEATGPVPTSVVGVRDLTRRRARVEARDGGGADLELAIHPLLSATLIVLFPGSREDLERSALPFAFIADNLQEAGLGAVVRCNNPLREPGRITELLHAHLRRLMEHVRAHAESICGIPRPRVAMMGYSSGAGALAAFAREYPEVDQLLLLAPSFDVGRKAIEPGLAAFTGDVDIVIGDSDRVVLPGQAGWFFDTAVRARRRRLVELICCDHGFSGEYNQALVRQAPLWAFGGNVEFPPPERSSP